MYEDDFSSRGEYEVGPPWQSTIVQDVPISHAVYQFPYDPLWFSVFGTNPRHELAALFRRESVHWRTVRKMGANFYRVLVRSGYLSP